MRDSVLGTELAKFATGVRYWLWQWQFACLATEGIGGQKAFHLMSQSVLEWFVQSYIHWLQLGCVPRWNELEFSACHVNSTLDAGCHVRGVTIKCHQLWTFNRFSIWFPNPTQSMRHFLFIQAFSCTILKQISHWTDLLSLSKCVSCFHESFQRGAHPQICEAVHQKSEGIVFPGYQFFS